MFIYIRMPNIFKGRCILVWVQKNMHRSDYYSIYKRISDSFKEEQDSIIQNKKDREFKVKYYITYLSKEGYLFPKKVLSAYSRGDISYGEMCSTLSIKGKHISNIERAVMFI